MSANPAQRSGHDGHSVWLYRRRVGQPLARVTTELEVPRGPDAEYRIDVHADWLRQGATVRIELPRKLPCPSCSGGGCDSCGRSGAVSLAPEGEAPEPLDLVLPVREPALGEFALRIPHHGALAADGDLPPGHLLVVVRATSEARSIPGVTRVATSEERHHSNAIERQQLMKRSLIVAACLIVTFVGLLRLSGWI